MQKINSLNLSPYKIVICALFICCSFLKLVHNFEGTKVIQAFGNETTSAQLTPNITYAGELSNTYPPVVPAASFTFIQNGSNGNGFNNKMFHSEFVNENLRTYYSLFRFISAKNTLCVFEKLATLCILRI
ncbi:MAG TPA: hypothetical protein PKD91_13915 [Bacteroidia bacterium]|nr:hypothetical protein [Bacteroidia bacterium]